MDPQSDLFQAGPAAPVDVAPSAAGFQGLAGRLPPRIRLGTSSWTFPGWSGRVYDREVPATVLARYGLRAYARHPLLRTVGVDRTYYGPVPEETYRAWAEAVPRDFRFVVKAPRALVTPGDPAFLDPSRARDEVLGPVEAGLRDRAGAILLQFPPLPPEALGGPRRFAERLYRFLRDLPAGVARSVEIRTPGWDTPDYRAALAHGGAGHGYVVHGRMTSLAEQVARGGPPPGATTVLRWMLAPGLGYEAARDAWTPFSRLQAPDPGRRREVADLARQAASGGGSVLVVINNKAEGCSPASVEALAALLADDDAPPNENAPEP